VASKSARPIRTVQNENPADGLAQTLTGSRFLSEDTLSFEEIRVTRYAAIELKLETEHECAPLVHGDGQILNPLVAFPYLTLINNVSQAWYGPPAGYWGAATPPNASPTLVYQTEWHPLTGEQCLPGRMPATSCNIFSIVV
jgi:hypothetical protein